MSGPRRGQAGAAALPSTLATDAEVEAALAGKIPLSVVDAADDLIVGTADNAVGRLAVAASRIIGKKAAGALGALTAAEVKTILALTAADISDFAAAVAAIAAMATDAEVTAAVAAAIAAEVTRADAAYAPFPEVLTSGEATVPRDRATSGAALTLTSQTLRLGFFTAQKTETITQVRLPSGSTQAAATPTLCRFGIYSVAGNGDGTLIQSIANDTTLWAAANTDYLRALQGNFNKVRGQRYAFGWLCVTGATAPIMPGQAILAGATPGNNAAGRAPRLAGSLAAQADLPNGFTEAGLSGAGARAYAELVL